VARALIVRHVDHEGVAGFRQPIEAAGYRIERIDATDPAFAALDWCDPALLVVMGGPMGVYDRAVHRWIDGEVAGLARRIDAGLPTLGVCLGSQLIAAACGARVYPGPIKEVGFAPIRLTDAGAASPLRHLRDMSVLHWHGDTFDLPTGAERLASTDAYPHQAFRVGETVLALQFHAEMGEDPRFARWLDDEAYIRAAGTDPDRIAADHARHGGAAVAAGRAMVAEWLAALPDAT
jgi:GMP synthase (glutamine-hydrolysing)